MSLKKPKYYSGDHLLKNYPECLYYIIFGERSNGKTYWSLNRCIERYFKYGEQFAYIRRFGEDVRKKNLGTLFDAHILNGVISDHSSGHYTSIIYQSGRFTPVYYDEDGKPVQSTEPAGFAFDLNSMEHHKSTSYPKVHTIVFDEFLSRQGYLPNEFVLFMNTLSTIIRSRDDVKIFMLGNTVNKFCPYFQEMGLTHIKEQKPGSVDVYTYADTMLSVAVEYCDPMSKRGGKASDVYFAFDNPQLKMITSGTWEIAIYPHLEKKYRPKDVAYNVFFEFDRALLHAEIVCTNESYFMFVHPKSTPIKKEGVDIIYTDKPSQMWNYRTGISNQRDKLSLFIKKLISENKVFYSDNETGEILRNYIMWSEKYSEVKGA